LGCPAISGHGWSRLFREARRAVVVENARPMGLIGRQALRRTLSGSCLKRLRKKAFQPDASDSTARVGGGPERGEALKISSSQNRGEPSPTLAFKLHKLDLKLAAEALTICPEMANAIHSGTIENTGDQTCNWVASHKARHSRRSPPHDTLPSSQGSEADASSLPIAAASNVSLPRRCAVWLEMTRNSETRQLLLRSSVSCRRPCCPLAPPRAS